jgi:hypothetical protein
MPSSKHKGGAAIPVHAVYIGTQSHEFAAHGSKALEGGMMERIPTPPVAPVHLRPVEQYYHTHIHTHTHAHTHTHSLTHSLTFAPWKSITSLCLCVSISLSLTHLHPVEQHRNSFSLSLSLSLFLSFSLSHAHTCAPWNTLAWIWRA